MILVTGASGQLGSQTLTELRAYGAHVEGASRQPAESVRRMDFDDPDTIHFEGVRTLVLVSAGYAEDDQVIARHAAVIDAAARQGVQHVIYTSLTGAGDHLGFALAHRATEQLIRDSGLAWTLLRNGLYAELFGSLLTWTEHGLESPFGAGALSAVARADLAAAAAKVALDPVGHEGRTYELVGTPVTVEEIAAQLGVSHRSMRLGDYRARLLAAAGLLAFQPPMLVSIATAVRHGFLDHTSPDLERLLDRPATDPLKVAAETAALRREAG